MAPASGDGRLGDHGGHLRFAVATRQHAQGEADRHPDSQHQEGRPTTGAVEERHGSQGCTARARGSSWPSVPHPDGNSSGALVSPDSGLPSNIMTAAPRPSPALPSRLSSPRMTLETAAIDSATTEALTQ